MIHNATLWGVSIYYACHITIVPLKYKNLLWQYDEKLIKFLYYFRSDKIADQRHTTLKRRCNQSFVKWL